jgi:parvulin-like peptidyl-prolyl isomerase
MQKFKLKSLSLIVLCAVMASQSLFAATTFGKPAAIVKFNGQTMPVTMDELNNQYESVKSIAQQQGLDESTAKKQVLEGIIDNKLFAAAAKRDGIVASDAVIDQLFAQQKVSVEQSAGKSITEAEYEDVIIKSVGSIDAYRDYLSTQWVLQQYISKVKGQEIQDGVTPPTDAEISSFYRSQKTKFINPETVNIGQIFIPFGDNDKNEQSEALLNDVSRQLKNGSITWIAAVKKYSKSGSSSVDGDIGWVTLDDTQNVKSIMGQEFFDAAFSTTVNTTSDVIKSTTGYHIIMIKQHEDAKMLSLNDKISPADTMTVKQYISNSLSQEKASNAYNSAIMDLSSTLRAQATITKLI